MRKARTLTIGLSAVVLLVLLAGLVLSPGCAKPAEEGKVINISMVGQYFPHEFFIPTTYGVADAVKEYSDIGVTVNVNWLGSTNYDMLETIRMVETELARGDIDGFILEAADPTMFFPVMERIQAELGVPVLLTNELYELDLFVSFCGYRAPEMGELVARQMELDLLGESAWAKAVGFEGSDPISGEISFQVDTTGRRSQEEGTKAGQEYLGQFPGIVNLGLRDTTADQSKAMGIIADIFTAHPNLVGIHAFGQTSAIASALVIEDLDLVGKVVIGGTDVGPVTLALVKSLSLSIVIGQNQYDQGYLPVKALVDYLLYDTPIPRFMPTELEIVNIANVDEIIAREEAYLAGK